jgi:hypothetical protein
MVILAILVQLYIGYYFIIIDMAANEKALHPCPIAWLRPR